ncbi:hypothetical protein ACHWQZ_G007207 [Mnemiopsis leidyi]
MGSRGSLTEFKADNPGNDREIGQTDTYIITDITDIGEFRCVSIRIDGDDGWLITEVRVEVDGTQLPTIPNKIGWLDDVLDRLTEVAFCLTDFVEYNVTTVTSTETNAATDAVVYFTIMGSRGSLTEFKADNPGDDRKRGQTDTYIITDNTDIGEFRCVSIRIDGDDGWIITEVRVEVDGTQLPTIPNKIGWLDDVIDKLTEVAFCVTDFGEYKLQSRLFSLRNGRSAFDRTSYINISNFVTFINREKSV